MTQTEALKLALEALKRITHRFDLESVTEDATKAIAAAEEALAQPAVPKGHKQSTPCGEPVAWIYEDELLESYPYDAMFEKSRVIDGVRMFPKIENLKNEPVLIVEKEPAYMSQGHYYEGTKPHIDPTKVWKLDIGTKLYTTPPTQQSCSQRQCNAVSMKHIKPLTDEQIAKMWQQYNPLHGIASFARAIEAAHGIKE